MEKYNISNKCIIQRLVETFKNQGYEGLEVSRKNNRYSLAFKLNAVNL